MKIAIASEGSDFKSAETSARAGRAPYYLIFEDAEVVEVLKNPFALGSGGAGWSVAHLLSEKGVELVVAEQFGQNMETALKEKRIKMKKISGKIIDAVKEFG